MASEDLIIVGKLGRTRGVNGALYVTLATDFPDRFDGLKEIFVRGRAGWEKMKLSATSNIGGRPVLHFEGIDNKEDATRLTNRSLGVPRETAVNLPEDTFFIFDVIGCSVFEEGTDRLLGEIINVEQFPANDVYVVRTTDGGKAMVAAAREFVKSIDIEGKKVIISNTGLLKDERS